MRLGSERARSWSGAKRWFVCAVMSDWMKLGRVWFPASPSCIESVIARYGLLTISRLVGTNPVFDECVGVLASI